MAEFNVVTHKDCEIIDITREINERVPAGLEYGICHIFCPHTTAGITVNENADPDVKRDMLAKLDELVPKREAYYRHYEGNSAAHLKAALLGFRWPCRSGTDGCCSGHGRESIFANSTGRAPAASSSFSRWRRNNPGG